ncbi:hypothetical protein BJ508DRAFT_320968 [Ascobolus immersus RN42]|uniref:Uncharacterized protein n=1 Tax=Ascobolus immersus RN42 TaxID=1160509 RepID=A0A3N4INR0_ASCIM|nr:hypothetical protein BJ508DRAFT_320968 [Ascobolus immersus RN42]
MSNPNYSRKRSTTSSPEPQQESKRHCPTCSCSARSTIHQQEIQSTGEQQGNSVGGDDSEQEDCAAGANEAEDGDREDGSKKVEDVEGGAKKVEDALPAATEEEEKDQGEMADGGIYELKGDRITRLKRYLKEARMWGRKQPSNCPFLQPGFRRFRRLIYSNCSAFSLLQLTKTAQTLRLELYDNPLVFKNAFGYGISEEYGNLRNNKFLSIYNILFLKDQEEMKLLYELYPIKRTS